MAIRKIATGQSPVLRTKAAPVREISRAVLQLLEDMAETMYHNQGVGLAAPQVSVPKRIIVLDPGENRLMEMINPVLIRSAGEATAVEGCLSLPGLMGEVPRAEQVLVRFLDRDGREQELELTGFEARIVQHELDHLDGILIIDRAVCLLEPASEEKEQQV